MKKYIVLLLFTLLFSCSNRLQLSYITESFIKNKIQSHISGEVSNLYINTIYKMTYTDNSSMNSGYEMSIVHSNNEKFLVISFYDDKIVNLNELNVLVLNEGHQRLFLTKSNLLKKIL